MLSCFCVRKSYVSTFVHIFVMKRHELVTGSGTIVNVHIDVYDPNCKETWNKEEWWVGDQILNHVGDGIKNLHEYYLTVKFGKGKEIEIYGTVLANRLGYCRPYFGTPKFKIGDKVEFFRINEDTATVISD